MQLFFYLDKEGSKWNITIKRNDVLQHKNFLPIEDLNANFPSFEVIMNKQLKRSNKGQQEEVPKRKHVYFKSNNNSRSPFWEKLFTDILASKPPLPPPRKLNKLVKKSAKNASGDKENNESSIETNASVFPPSSVKPLVLAPPPSNHSTRKSLQEATIEKTSLKRQAEGSKGREEAQNKKAKNGPSSINTNASVFPPSSVKPLVPAPPASNHLIRHINFDEDGQTSVEAPSSKKHPEPPPASAFLVPFNNAEDEWENNEKRSGEDVEDANETEEDTEDDETSVEAPSSKKHPELPSASAFLVPFNNAEDEWENNEKRSGEDVEDANEDDEEERDKANNSKVVSSTQSDMVSSLSANLPASKIWFADKDKPAVEKLTREFLANAADHVKTQIISNAKMKHAVVRYFLATASLAGNSSVVIPVDWFSCFNSLYEQEFEAEVEAEALARSQLSKTELQAAKLDKVAQEQKVAKHSMAKRIRRAIRVTARYCVGIVKELLRMLEDCEEDDDLQDMLDIYMKDNRGVIYAAKGLKFLANDECTKMFIAIIEGDMDGARKLPSCYAEAQKKAKSDLPTIQENQTTVNNNSSAKAFEVEEETYPEISEQNRHNGAKILN